MRRMPPERLIIILLAVIGAAAASVALLIFLPSGMRAWLIPALLAVALLVQKLVRRR